MSFIKTYYISIDHWLWNRVICNIYNLEIVAGEGNKDYFTEAYEKVPAGEFVEIYIYWIDGRVYYVPYHNSKEVADSLDYTDFMNACVECGISFSTQEEVDAIIEAKKAEYGFWAI